jgi:hypothetical protein
MAVRRRVADPIRHPVDATLSLLNPIGSAIDKVRVGVFRLKALLGPQEAIFTADETSTEQRLRVRSTAPAHACRGPTHAALSR